MLTADEFFSLEEVAFRSLWAKEEPVWNALHHLYEFLFQYAKHLAPVAVSCFPGVHFVNPEQIFLGEGTVCEPGAYLRGPCVIGRNCEIRNGAYLRGGVLTGDQCVIGHGTEIKHTILLNEVEVAHFAYVGDSILGNRSHLGAGVKCANLRLDKREIHVFLQNQKLSTGLLKLGVVLGDQCQIGCNSVINPGTFIGTKSIAYPLSSLHGIIPARVRVREKEGSLEMISLGEAVLEWLRK